MIAALLKEQQRKHHCRRAPDALSGMPCHGMFCSEERRNDKVGTRGSLYSSRSKLYENRMKENAFFAAQPKKDSVDAN
jgi:hypothetical protein